MVLNETTVNIINITIQVLLISLWVAIPVTMMLVLMYAYKHYKKWENKEVKEAERIIVKKNNDINKASGTVTLLSAKIDELEKEVETLTAKKQALQLELGENPDDEEPEAPVIDLEALSIKELQAIAKEQRIKGFSRMKKAKLINILNGSK